MASKKSSPMSVGAMDKKWQAESDMGTLARAEEIKKDPKRFNAALEMAKAKIAEMRGVIADAAEDRAEGE